MREVGRQPAKAAFEVKKGIRQVMTLSEADVEKYLDPRELLTGLEDDAFSRARAGGSSVSTSAQIVSCR